MHPKVRETTICDTTASLMLADWVQMETIQMILEHSNIGMTMNAWAQLKPDSQRLGAAAFDTILGKEAEYGLDRAHFRVPVAVSRIA